MNKKSLKLNYLQSPRPIGIFAIRNLVNDKVYIGQSENLDGIFNRIEFQLKANCHTQKDLQLDWNEFGSEKFKFEVLEQLELRENLDIKKELEFLEDLWLEKLKPFGNCGYNEPKKTREQRLQMIAANRLK
jgi:group I intron endonuclease